MDDSYDEGRFTLQDDISRTIEQLAYLRDTLLYDIEPDEDRFQRWVDELVAEAKTGWVGLEEEERVRVQLEVKAVETVNCDTILPFDVPISMTEVASTGVRVLSSDLAEKLEQRRDGAHMGDVVDTDVQDRYEVESVYEVHQDAVDHSQGNESQR